MFWHDQLEAAEAARNARIRRRLAEGQITPRVADLLLGKYDYLLKEKRDGR